MKFLGISLALILLIFAVWFTVTNKAVLVSQNLYDKGDPVDPVFEEWATDGIYTNNQKGLGCKYWRFGMQARMHWYSPNNFMGSSACAFFIDVTID